MFGTEWGRAGWHRQEPPATSSSPQMGIFGWPKLNGSFTWPCTDVTPSPLGIEGVQPVRGRNRRHLLMGLLPLLPPKLRRNSGEITLRGKQLLRPKWSIAVAMTSMQGKVAGCRQPRRLRFKVGVASCPPFPTTGLGDRGKVQETVFIRQQSPGRGEAPFYPFTPQITILSV